MCIFSRSGANKENQQGDDEQQTNNNNNSEEGKTDQSNGNNAAATEGSDLQTTKTGVAEQVNQAPTGDSRQQP